MNARQLAADVLRRVIQDGAYAAAALSIGLSRSSLGEKDRGLATELVYGVLRTQGALTRLIEERGKVKESDLVLLSHLLVAAYQIEFLDRVPDRAAVNEAVESIRAARGKRIAGFANAVLRGLGRREPEKRLNYQESVLQSYPSWLRKRLKRDVGEENAIELLSPRVSPRPCLRVLAPAKVPWLSDKTSACAGVPLAFQFEAGGDPRSLPGFEEGAYVVQELGAQLVAHALGAQPGERILDVCAGRGQKTSLLAHAVTESGKVVATDLHNHKVRELSDEMKRLGLEVQAEVWDWAQPPPEHMRGAFDRVIVDAPCSGVGTLRRRPEIARRLTAEDPKRLAELQLKILIHAAQALRPGGVLLFATCSVLREEGEDVVERLVQESALTPGAVPTPVDRALFGEGEVTPQVRLLPEEHGTDGYFLIRFRAPSA